jgi:hypothetical protein
MQGSTYLPKVDCRSQDSLTDLTARALASISQAHHRGETSRRHQGAACRLASMPAVHLCESTSRHFRQAQACSGDLCRTLDTAAQQ